MTTCAPVEAWTEPIEHPAIGSPTITIDNPDYLPAVEAHDIVTGNIIKWNWTGGPTDSTPASPLIDATGWHLVGTTNDSKGNALDVVVHQGNGKASFFYYQTEVQHVEAQPAQGTPTIEVANPDYVAAWTEYVEHDATTCPVEQPAPVPPLDCPEGKVPGWLDENGNPQGCVDNNPTPLEPKPEPPVEKPGQVIPVQPDITVPAVIETAAQAEPMELAETGVADILGLALLAAVLIAGGVALMRKARRHA